MNGHKGTGGIVELIDEGEERKFQKKYEERQLKFKGS